MKNSYYHNEVLEFADWIQINTEELQIRYNLLSDIESLIKQHISRAEVCMFGSTANRLALPSSDIDLLVFVPGITTSSSYSMLFDAILHIILGSKSFNEIEPIYTSQVPIISARHIKSGISIDLVIDRDDGLQGLCLVTTLDDTFKELRPLYLLTKAFLCSKNVHKPWKGGIGSFVLVNLIIAFL